MTEGAMNFNYDEAMINYKEKSIIDYDNSLRELNKLIDIEVDKKMI